MKHCDQELIVAKSVRTGHWSPATEAHLEACAVCKEAAQVARWMQSLAQQAEPSTVLHPAGETPALQHAAERRRDAGATAMREASWLWCRTLLDQKEKEIRQARRRLALIETGSAVFVGLLLLGWVRWNWTAIEAALGSMASAIAVRAATWWLLPSSGGLFSIPFTMLLALGGVAALLVSYPLLSEE